MCGGDIEERGGRGVAESPVRRTYTQSLAHKVTPYYTVHGCKISNIHGMASCHTPDRSITRMRASLVLCYSAQPRVAIDPRRRKGYKSNPGPGRDQRLGWTRVFIG